MTISSWISESTKRIRRDGWKGMRDSLRPVYIKSLTNVPRSQKGISIYDRDWDLLIVLDACRYDLFCEVAEEYEFISQVDSFPSVNTATARWMELTFKPNQLPIEETAYINGNPFSEQILNVDWFQHLEEVWKDSWTEPGTVPPRAVSDRLIDYSRKNAPERMIAHYMQPHCPFLSEPELSEGKRLDKFGNQNWLDVWGRLREGELTESQVWDAYRDNLRIALDEVKFVLKQVDAERVIVTSDHGNAKGEWGIYGHPPDMPIRYLFEVPWVETTAEDTGTYEPTIERKSDSIETEGKLRALGYLN